MSTNPDKKNKAKPLIESLTPQQEAMLDVYAKRYTEMGLSIKPIDHTKAEEILRRCYTLQGLLAPQQILWYPSPFAMMVGAARMKVRDELIDKGIPETEAEEQSNQIFDVSKELSKEAKSRVSSMLDNCCFGQHEAGWLSWVQFFREEVGLKEETEEIVALIETAEALHWWLPFENICFASERPIEQHMTDPDAEGNRNLHKNGGPALRYAEGFSLYMLNGVEVPEWLAVTPATELDAKKVISLDNAEQRKEGIKKLGLEKLFKELKAEVIDTLKFTETIESVANWEALPAFLRNSTGASREVLEAAGAVFKKYENPQHYELVTIEFEGRRIGPYLKMVNDSTGQIHVEGVGEVTVGGVDTKITTCEQALAWRGGFDRFIKPGWTA
jgi:hypothetical protein